MDSLGNNSIKYDSLWNVFIDEGGIANKLMILEKVGLGL